MNEGGGCDRCGVSRVPAGKVIQDKVKRPSDPEDTKLFKSNYEVALRLSNLESDGLT